MPPNNKRRRFTVTELVVMVVAVVTLMGLCFPGIGPQIHGAARRANALNDETQYVTAINAFYTDYGYYPCERNNGDDSKDYFVNGGAGEAQLLNTLGDKNPNNDIIRKLNPHGTIYLDVPVANNLTSPRGKIGPDGVWYDPWGNPYLVKIDSNYNGIILNPYSANAGPAQLKPGVIVWSLGSDGKGATSATGNGDKNTGIFYDDVLSWQ